MESQKPLPPALLFDLDGTLVDSTRDIADSLNRSLENLIPGFTPYSTEEVKGFIGDGVSSLIKRALPPGKDDLFDSVLVEFKTVYKNNLLNFTVPYPGVLETLNNLHKNYRLFVISNKDQGFSELILEGLGILDLFVTVIGGDTLPSRKPSPVSVEHIQRTYGDPPATMVMVGDNHTDLAMAVAARIPSIFCTFGMGQAQDVPFTEKADHFSSIPEILSRILDQNQP